jgi:hypothetical protein
MTAVTPDERVPSPGAHGAEADEADVAASGVEGRRRPAPADGGTGGWMDRFALALVRAWPEGVLTFLAVVGSCIFVAVQVNPEWLVFRDNTPTGGDMGAHVWGPAFLRDHLLPDLRLSGWTDDWYAGFPAFQFYMVVPMLAIVALNVGLAVPVAVAATSLWAFVLLRLARSGRFLRPALVLTPLLLALLWPIPYGIAFKVVVVAGLVTMPLSAWALARLAGLPFPAPVLFPAASLLFVFDRSFNIFGGNAASTMAGEFAFSIALSLSLVTIGLVARGLDTGRHRALAALLIALTGLSHLIVAFFVLAVVAVLFLLRLDAARLWAILTVGAAVPGVAAYWAWGPGGTLATAVGVAGGLAAVALVAIRPSSLPAFAAAAVAVALSGVADPLVGAVAGGLVALVLLARLEPLRSWWLVSAGVVAGLVSAFWWLPFLLGRHYMNDMGWTKLVAFESLLLRRDVLNPSETLSDSPPFEVFAALAVAGFVLSLLKRRRLGVALGLVAVLIAFGFVHLPESRLWNARLLPFWYLCLYFLAAIAVAETARAVATLAARPPRDEVRGVVLAAPVAGLVAAVVFLGMGLHGLPFGADRDRSRHRERRVPLAGGTVVARAGQPHHHRPELHPRLGPLELLGLRAQGRLARVPRPGRHHGRGG